MKDGGKNLQVRSAAGRPVTICNAHPVLRLTRPSVARAIHALDTHYAELAWRQGGEVAAQEDEWLKGELSLAFLTDDALAKLHADFLEDPTPTDVITFPGDPDHGIGGEICISVDAALRQLGLQPKRGVGESRAADFAAELTLYLVHGWLHLAGHDDLVPAAKRRMRAAEKRALGVLRAKGAWPVFALGDK